MRLFIAVELSEEARRVIHGGLGVLRRDLPPARWVRVEAMHLTLKFLGEQPADLVDALDARVRPALAGFAPETVRLGGGGFFPSPRRPRVAWIGGSAPALVAWAEAIDRAAEELGVAREPRPFSLHLTLARLERPWGERAVESFLVKTGKWSFAPSLAREVVLFSSDLRPSGAVYTALGRWPVGAGESGA